MPLIPLPLNEGNDPHSLGDGADNTQLPKHIHKHSLKVASGIQSLTPVVGQAKVVFPIHWASYTH